MYCKNCGKHLEEGTRFCDRCGQSVRKSGSSEQAERHRNIEELKEERLNRKKRLAEKEAREAMKNERRKKRRKSNRGVGLFFIIVILLAAVSMLITYHLVRTDSKNAALNQDVTATATPTATTSTNVVVSTQTTQQPSATASSTTSSTESTTASAGDEEYRVFEINNVGCPYPSSFSKKSVSGTEKLSLVDTNGGATMSISQEQGVNGTAAELMKEYAGTVGVNPEYSLAGKDNYVITMEKNNTVYHRKCIISGTTAIYYDFQYLKTSSSRAQYEQCIAYIDENMAAK
jgi:cytoskeletal protein RodZ